MINNNFIVVTPLYNVEKWVKRCLNSVAKQQYKNFSHYLIDDISTDNTNSIIKKHSDTCENTVLITNTEKKYALKNIYDTLEDLNLSDDDIVVILDGDDCLANDEVFSTLNEIYNREDCWMTYGSYVEYPSMKKGKFAKKIPNHIIENSSYRSSEWMSSHLRTFRYGLWKKIKKKDLIDERTGNFIKAAWDLAFIFPMLEMCGTKALYIDKVFYVYNRQNPLNEDKVNHSKQLGEENYIRSKKKYQRINKL
jgi:glycosyltransferase involved in cell wall biosynthesis